MNHFYRTLLQQSEDKHAAAVAAASKPIIGPARPDEATQSFVIKRPEDNAQQQISDLEKARIAREQGKEVELNDDNQIVDKRELLSAGLNLSGKNTRDLSSLRKSRTTNNATESGPIHTAVGAAASKREIEDRRRRELEHQLKEEKERRLREQERQEAEAREKVVKRRNDDESVKSALDRYRERKRRKLKTEAQNEGGE